MPCNPDNGSQAKFTDVLIYPSLHTRGPLTTDLYDKRREPEFRSRLTPYKFPHADTLLSSTCKANVFTSQFVRYTGMIQNVANFVCEIANLILDLTRLGHNQRAMLKKCWLMLKSRPYLYCVGQQQSEHRAHSHGLYQQIYRRVRNNLHTCDA